MDVFQAFQSASSFDQDISDWNISSVTTMSDIFRYTAFSDINKGLIHESFSLIRTGHTTGENLFLLTTRISIPVNLWFDNQAEANATYGHISGWDVSEVTNMRDAFLTENLSMKISVSGIRAL